MELVGAFNVVLTGRIVVGTSVTLLRTPRGVIMVSNRSICPFTGSHSVDTQLMGIKRAESLAAAAHNNRFSNYSLLCH